ncbi:MAG: hypothetical protein HY318_02270 [Armatimonadetes bacterium]|nr:hypothetical protein [Armatimonadota bacterium]
MSKSFVFRISGITSAVLLSMVLGGGIAVGAEAVPWVDQEPTPVARMRPLLESAAVELIRQPQLEEEVNYYLQQSRIWVRFNVSTIGKLERLYSEMIDPSLNRVSRASHSAEVFGQLGMPVIVMEALKHPSDDVMRTAVMLFERLPYRPAAENLVVLLRRNKLLVAGNDLASGHNAFRESLVRALGNITGLDCDKVNLYKVGAVEEFIGKCEAWVKAHPLSKPQPPQERAPGVKQ